MSQKPRSYRSYVGELEWVIDVLHRLLVHRDDGFEMGVNKVLQFANAVKEARRNHGIIPDRPDLPQEGA